jgi:NAD+ diphosphatase
MTNSPPLSGLALSRGAVNRAGHHRTDTEWLTTRWKDDASRVFIVSDGHVSVEGDPPELVLVAPAAMADVAPEDRWFLGLTADDTAIFAVPGDLPDTAERANLRQVGALLPDRDAGLMTTAVALAAWHATHTHCPQCGAPTTITEAGMVRVCTVDGSLHHPRVDPAVIMTVIDDDDRLLLGHQTRWPARRFSTLAGFVEPGESLEQAIAREVLEETGVVVDSGELPRQPAVAISQQPHAGLHCTRGHHADHGGRCGDQRGALVHPRRPCRSGRIRRCAAAPACLHRPTPDRALVRRSTQPSLVGLVVRIARPAGQR